MNKLQEIEKEYLRTDVPEFRSGDTLKVHVRVREGDKERIQIFQGVVISRKGSGTNESFSVRKMSGGIGVERGVAVRIAGPLVHGQKWLADVAERQLLQIREVVDRGVVPLTGATPGPDHRCERLARLMHFRSRTHRR